MKFTDSHCHIQDHFGSAPDAIQRAKSAGVDRMVVVGCDLETSDQAIAISHANENVYATVGLHPHEAVHLDSQRHDLEGRVGKPGVVGVGEAGLDYFYEHSPREDQHAAFRWQIQLAHRHDLALVIHSRDAWEDTFAILNSETVPPRTIFHCFTGGPSEAATAVELGAYISFSGIVSFPKALSVREAAKTVPLERVLVETDSPFLAPVPMRGQVNEPANVVRVAEVVAAIRGEPLETIAAATHQNAEQVFRLS